MTEVALYDAEGKMVRDPRRVSPGVGTQTIVWKPEEWHPLRHVTHIGVGRIGEGKFVAMVACDSWMNGADTFTLTLNTEQTAGRSKIYECWLWE